MLLRRAFLLGSVTWTACLPLTAFAASRAEAAPLVYGFAVAMYGVGHLICHQLPSRSFHLWGAALPVCARCTGIYVGASMAAVALNLAWRRPARARRGKPDAARPRGLVEPRFVLLLAIIPTAVTLVFEWTTGVTPPHWIRAAAGVPLGAAVAWAVGMVN